VEKPPIEAVLRHYGFNGTIPHRHGYVKILCPFHDERVPSATVNTETDYFTCFACNIKGDSFDIIQLQERLDGFASTVEYAESLFGEQYGGILSKSQGKPRRRVSGETGPKRGQRTAFSSRVRRKSRPRA